jgi:hypothetical protein
MIMVWQEAALPMCYIVQETTTMSMPLSRTVAAAWGAVVLRFDRVTNLSAILDKSTRTKICNNITFPRQQWLRYCVYGLSSLAA